MEQPPRPSSPGSSFRTHAVTKPCPPDMPRENECGSGPARRKAPASRQKQARGWQLRHARTGRHAAVAPAERRECCWAEASANGECGARARSSSWLADGCAPAGARGQTSLRRGRPGSEPRCSRAARWVSELRVPVTRRGHFGEGVGRIPQTASAESALAAGRPNPDPNACPGTLT
jgi:hypothetical protein